MWGPRAKLSALLWLVVSSGACAEDDFVPPKAVSTTGGGAGGTAGASGAGARAGSGTSGAGGVLGAPGGNAASGAAGSPAGSAGASSGASGAGVGGAAGAAGTGGIAGAVSSAGASGGEMGGAAGTSSSAGQGGLAGGGASSGAGVTSGGAGNAGAAGGAGGASGGGQAGSGGQSAGAGGTGCASTAETCNGKDDDCDGGIDEGPLALDAKGAGHARGACIGFTSSTDASGFPLGFALIQGDDAFGNEPRELYHSLVFGVDATGAFVDVTIAIREVGKDESVLLGTARVVLGGGPKPKTVLAKDVTGNVTFGVAKSLKLLGNHAPKDDETHDFAIPLENVLDGTSYPAPNAIVLRVVGQYAPNMSGGDAATRVVVPGKSVGVERGF